MACGRSRRGGVAQAQVSVVVVVAVVVVGCLLQVSIARGGGGGTRAWEGQLVPGAPAPPFTVPTLDGLFVFDPQQARKGPLLVFAYNATDAFSRTMWTTDAYLDDFLLNATLTSEYLFMSYSEDVAYDEVAQMRTRLLERMKALAFSAAEVDQWLGRMHFVTQPVTNLDNWIPDLLAQWNSTVYQLSVQANDFSFQVDRLDARYDWLPYVFLTFSSDQQLPISWFGDGCSSQSAQNVSGKLALISKQPITPSCDYFVKVQNAQKAGAIGVVMYTDQSEALIDMNCQGDAECSTQLNIPGTMISYQAGISLRALLQDQTLNVTISFTNTTSSGFYLVVDQQALVQELGWLKMPTLMHYAWASQWYDYYTRMLSELHSYDFNVPIAANIVNNNKYTASVSFPSRNTILQRWTNLTLDLALSCLGTRDEDCPIWDRIYSMSVCCEGSPDECQHKEIGRWITPFRRRVGRWLTPSEPLLALLTYSPTADYDRPFFCNFTFGTGTGEPWVSTINLLWNDADSKPSPLISARDISDSDSISKPPIPSKYQFLWAGGNFNINYTYAPIPFSPPRGTVKTELVTIITGHGSDVNGCGEFCNIVHNFVVNGKYTHTQSSPQAATALGCANKVPDGSIPNEHGTWLYGRGGWCDGMNVRPYVRDITSELVPGVNQIWYYATYNGQPPHQTGGFVVMSSYLVYWM